MKDLEETFTVLRKYKLKINPAKCVFRAASGELLDFVIIIWGLR